MSQSPQNKNRLLRRPATDKRDKWHIYWRVQNQLWRTEPEIVKDRQLFLAERRSMIPNSEQEIYPFKDIKLSRADVEWLLATHENGRGPIDWNDKGQRGRKRLDLRGVDLCNVDLHDLPLDRVDLAGAALREASLFGTQLRNAELREARLEKADFTEAHLDLANLYGAHLVEAKLIRAQLTEANLNGVRLQNANLSKAQLKKAQFIKANLREANLREAHLEGADLSEAQLEEADLYKARLEEADLNNAQMERVHLREANLSSANLNHTQLEKTDLREAVLDGAFLISADLQSANLSGAKLNGTLLISADLQSANLSGAKLNGVHLSGARLEGADLTGAWLVEADLREVRLEGARLENTVLSDDRCIGPKIADVQWGSTNLAVVDWSKVKILGDEHVVQLSKTSKVDKEKTIALLKDYRIAVRANRQLAIALQNQGLNEVAGRFAYLAQGLQRKVFWIQREFGRWLFSFFLASLTGYGYRLWRILAAYLIVIFPCTIAYFVIGMYHPPRLTWPQALLESIIAFHGRVFFEFFTPNTPQIWVTAFEAIAGLVIEGVFIAMLTQRFFGK